MVALLVVHRHEQELRGRARGDERAKKNQGGSEQPRTRSDHVER